MSCLLWSCADTVDYGEPWNFDFGSRTPLEIPNFILHIVRTTCQDAEYLLSAGWKAGNLMKLDRNILGPPDEKCQKENGSKWWGMLLFLKSTKPHQRSFARICWVLALATKEKLKKEVYIELDCCAADPIHMSH